MAWRARLACLAALVAAAPAGLAEDARAWGPWTSSHDAGGVKVECRKNRDSGVVQTRATCIVACPPEDLWKRITTPESYVALMPNAEVSEHLEDWPDRGELIVYQRVDGSPSSDRDYTLRVTWQAERTARGTAYRRGWRVENDAGPAPVEGVVRVATNEGAWTLRPTPDGRTEFEYVNYIELGGSLWTSLGNGAAKDSARGFLENLVRACAGAAP